MKGGATDLGSTDQRVVAFDELLLQLQEFARAPSFDVHREVPRLHRLARENRPVFEHAIAVMADAYRECRRHNGGSEDALDWPTDHPKRRLLNWLIELLKGQPVDVAKLIFDDLTSAPAVERADPPGTRRWYVQFRGLFTNEITLVADDRGTISEIFWED